MTKTKPYPEVPKKKRKKPITAEIERQDPKTLPTGVHYEVRFDLTDEQQIFIQQVAERLDISYNNAFKKVWHDAFGLLQQQTDVRHTYRNLPTVENN